jgi:hypothetical protein
VPPPIPHIPAVNNLPLPDESFLHIFFECDKTKKAIKSFINKHVAEWADCTDQDIREFLFIGKNLLTLKRDNFFISTLAINIMFYIWECKLQKKIPSGEGLANFVFYNVESIRRASTTLRTAMSINLAICRGWKAESDRRR